MQTDFNLQAYLQRIGYEGPVEPTLELLRTIHRLHLLAVPFENLDIHFGPPIHLNTAAFYEKIVNKKRGGFCYELNAPRLKSKSETKEKQKAWWILL